MKKFENLLLISPVKPFELSENKRFTHYSEKYLRLFCNKMSVFNYRSNLLWSKLHLLKMNFPIVKRYEDSLINKKLISICEKNSYDYILTFKAENIFYETFKKIKKNSNTKLITWLGDSPFRFENIYDCLPLYDHIFIWDSGYINNLKKFCKSSHLLPFCYIPEIHDEISINPDEFKKYQCDVLFVGTWDQKREYILSKLTNYDLKIFGPGWLENSKIPSNYLGGFLEYNQMLKAFKTSKININIHHLQGINDANCRTFEVLGTKSFLIDEDNSDITTFFENGKDIITYSIFDDLKEKIDYYLKNPIARQKIINNGYNKCLSSHTLLHRMKTLTQNCLDNSYL
jgi:spore maturation protein CgeB